MLWNTLHRMLQYLLFVISGLLLCDTAVLAASVMEPPSVALRSAVSNVVVARLETLEVSATAHFTRVHDLHNQAPQQFQLQLTPELAAQLSSGRDYIVAFVCWQLQRHSKVLMPRPDGAVLISVPGAEPAIFSDTPLLRAMLTTPVVDAAESAAQLLPLIRQGLLSDDWQYQSFFLTELLARPALQQLLTEADYGALSQLATNFDAAPTVLQALLLSDWPLQDYTLAQRLDFVRLLLRYQSLYHSAHSPYPRLIRTAMHYLAQHGQTDDSALLLRWLHTNHHGLFDSALHTLLQLAVPQPGPGQIITASPCIKHVAVDDYLDSLLARVNHTLQRTLLSQEQRNLLHNFSRRLTAVIAQQSTTMSNPSTRSKALLCVDSSVFASSRIARIE